MDKPKEPAPKEPVPTLSDVAKQNAVAGIPLPPKQVKKEGKQHSMRLEDLLECSAERLEKLSDAELIAILQPYFPITRPELAVKTEKPAAKVEKQKTFQDLEKEAKIKKAKELAKQMGIDIT